MIRNFSRLLALFVPLMVLSSCATGSRLYVPGDLSRPGGPAATPPGAPQAAVMDFSYASSGSPGVVGRDYDQVREIMWKGDPGRAMADLVADALMEKGVPVVRVRGGADVPPAVPVRISGSVHRFEVDARRSGMLHVEMNATVSVAVSAAGSTLSAPWVSTITSSTSLGDAFVTPDGAREALFSAANTVASEAGRKLIEAGIVSPSSPPSKEAAGTSR